MFNNIIKMFRFRMFHDYSFKRYMSNYMPAIILVLILMHIIESQLELMDLIYLMFMLHPGAKVLASSFKKLKAILNSLKIKYLHYYLYSLVYALIYGTLTFVLTATAIQFDLIRVVLPSFTVIEMYIFFILINVFIIAILELLRIVLAVKSGVALKVMMLFGSTLLIISALILSIYYVEKGFITIWGYALAIVLLIVISIVTNLLSKMEIRAKMSKMEVYYAANH